jgi:hypothetical protein
MQPDTFLFMKKIHGLLLSGLLLILPSTLRSQQTSAPDSLLNRLTGKWILSGEIDGQKTTHDITAQRVLNGQYVQIKEVSREKDPSGKPLYDAIIYLCWEESKKQYSCLWLDNTSNGGLSNGIIGRASYNGDKIEMIFTFSETSRFHTAFLYDRIGDTWQWLMDADDNGKRQPFARVKLTKK